MKISEIITDKYKLRIPPTVYYDLLADVQEAEDEQEPTANNDLGVDREDAVERLNAFKQLIGYDKDSEIVKATQKSLDMAIKALVQEPCEDCISREAVDRIINKWLSHPDYELKDHIYSMTEKIHNLPSVTPQEPTDRNFTKADIDSIVTAINAHWELIIDEIRAEVEMEKLEDSPNFCVKAYNNAVDRVLGILDKYKAETEEKE